MAAVPVTDAAVALVAPTGSRRDVTVYNAGAETVYVDVGSATAAGGMPVGVGAYLTISMGEAETLYGICATGKTATARVTTAREISLPGNGVAYAVALTGSDQAVSAVPVRYRGFALQETGGSAEVTVDIYDNDDAASGTLLDTVRLSPGESASVLHDGIWASAGVYVDVGGTGTVKGSIRIG
jgi:hypothetical protein